MAVRASSSSSFSSFNYGWTYDVFLSFRGEDTRHGFTGNLYNSLLLKGIHTFIDDEQLQRGDQIIPSLLKAIKESRIAIIVLSNDYASSSFCLDELAYILDGIKSKGPLVLPVFYDVDPSDVRHLRGSFGEALAKHEKRLKDNVENKLENWKMALHQVSNLSGYHFKKEKNEYEYEFIGKIVGDVSNKINRVPLHVADYPVGLESRMLEVNSLLNVRSDDGVHMVGIYGIGGIGKTTLARAVYNLVADHFDGLCFLNDVRENSVNHGLVHLQEKLLSKIVGLNNKLGDVNEGIPIIKHRLHKKKVLLVLDDVDKVEQLRAIAGAADWFGFGSRIIITTRDKHLLACHKVEKIYEVEGLKEEDALELLSWNAFRNDKVDPSFVDKLNRAVTYASGLPLGLEVIGSNLFGKRIEEWKSALDGYERIPNKEIQKILKVSFDALEEDEQKIFLDIACCFKGYELAECEDILCAHHGDCMKYGIGVLVSKSLIKISQFGDVTLHDLIQDMGREIVRQESPKEPGERSRLWFFKDIIQVFQENSGTSNIEIIDLVLPKFEEVTWDREALKKMKNLRTLIIRNCHFSESPKHLPNSLRVLEWWGYPSPSLPSDFDLHKLIIFKLPNSCLISLKLPVKKLVNLTVLNFNGSKFITEICDVSGVPNLKKLSFQYCENLIKIHGSVGLLDKLRVLNAYGCSKLRTFPPIKLTSLEQLELSDCSSLKSFPEILGKMENITQLYLENTAIKEFSFSMQNFTRLQYLQLCCSGMVMIPSGNVMWPELNNLAVVDCDSLLLPKQGKGKEQVSSMEFLCLRHCNMSDEFLQVGLPWFPNVKELNLSENNFTILPACIKEFLFLRKLKLDNCKKLLEIRGLPLNLETLSARSCTSLKDLDFTLLPSSTKECCFLWKLVLDDCKNLREIRVVPPNMKYFSAIDCISLTSQCRSMLLNEELHQTAGYKRFQLPGTRIPEWFEYCSKGASIYLYFCNKFPVIALCVVIGGFNPMTSDSFLKLTINGNTVGKIFRNNFNYSNVDHVFIFDEPKIELKDIMDEALSENEWNSVEVSVDIVNFVGWKLKDPFVKEIGVHVFKQKSSLENIRFTNPYKMHGEVTIVSQKQFMQQQPTLASLALLEPHVGQGREWLSVLPPPALMSLNNNVNWDSNSMASTQIGSTTNVQGCGIATRRRRKGTLRLGLDCEARPAKVALDSDSIMSSLACDTANEGDIPKLQELALFNPTIPTRCETLEYTQADRGMYYGISDWLSMCPCWEQPLDYRYCNSDSVESARTIDTTNDIDKAVLDHPEKAPGESSQALGFPEAQNIQASGAPLSIGKVSGEELHLKTCCTVLPTAIGGFLKNQTQLTQDDVEMEAFYASLDDESPVLSRSQNKLATTAPREEAMEALKIVQDFISYDASVLLHPERSRVMETSLDYLSNLSADDCISGEMGTLISEASRMFTHWRRDYMEASMNIEYTASELQRAAELEMSLEGNKKMFREVLENELLDKFARMEESKKELEMQIPNKSDISASQSGKNLTHKRKRDIFEEGKTLKTQMDELREKLPHLQHEQGLAKKIQEKIKAERSNLREKFKKIVAESEMYKN